jgi:hypothetical protein
MSEYAQATTFVPQLRVLPRVECQLLAPPDLVCRSFLEIIGYVFSI